MNKISERFLWASNLIDAKPNNSVLEIGCGAGILAEQIAIKLNGSGRLTAVDRSVAMIKQAIKRNIRFIEDGIADFRVSEFLAFEPPDTYDKIVAFNVNFFWKNPERELEIIRKALKKEGLLYVFYQGPFEIDTSLANIIKGKLQSFSFSIVDTVFEKLTPTSAFCIISKPRM